MNLRGLITLGFIALGVLALDVPPADAAGPTHSFTAFYGAEEIPSGELEPTGVAVNRTNGDVYVGAGPVVDVFNSAGKYEPALQLTGTPPAALVSGPFSYVRGVAIDQRTGDLYVADGSSGVIDVFSSSGAFLSQINGSQTPAESMFPFGVAVDEATGDVYVADLDNDAVDVFNAAGEYEPSSRLAGTPASAPVPGEFGAVRGVAIDQTTGDVYVTDIGNGVADVFARSGEYLSQINGKETPAGAMLPWGIAVDPANGELYVGDLEAGAIDEFNTSGEYRGQIQGSEAQGGSLTPFGVAVGQNSNVYIADYSNRFVDVFSTVLPPAPVVVALPVSNLGGEGATLNSTVNPEGLAVSSCVTEYGSTELYGYSFDCAPSPGAVNEPVPVTASLSQLEPNTVYHYRTLAVTVNGRSATKDQTFRTAKIAPSVSGQTAFASEVSQFTAKLNATVNPHNVPGSYHFVYGTTPAYGSIAPVPDTSLPINNTADPAAQALSGLQPGTTYHFAVVANSPAGTTTGPDETFTTPSVPAPAATTGASEGPTVGTVTLTGAVDPRGWATTYSFQYGTNTAYGSSWPTVAVQMGALTGAQPVSIYVRNLQPGTTYHYRLVAADAGGTSYGADETFTTASYPASAVAETPLLSTRLGINPESSKPAKTKSKGKHKKKARGRKKTRKKSKGRKQG